jgi:hypothetical protein
MLNQYIVTYYHRCQLKLAALARFDQRRPLTSNSRKQISNIAEKDSSFSQGIEGILI